MTTDSAFAALPAPLRAVLDLEPAAGDPLDVIEHVVILMQENRGLDHYFGTLPGVRGHDDRSALLRVFEQADGVGGTVSPHLVDEQAIVGQPHNWSDGHEAWNDGRMDRWVPAKGAQTMSYYRREDIPFYYALADAFTVCDAYHCSVLGPTTPNRSYLFSGNAGDEPWGDRAVTNEAWDRPGHTGYEWTSYAERLQAAGVSWQVLQEWDNFGDNNLEYHVAFKQVARKAFAATGFPEGRYFYDAFLAADEDRRAELVKLLADGVGALTPDERELYDRALRRVPTGTLAEAFEAAITGGTLPKVTYLVASQAECEHPDSGTDAATGAALTERLISALASRPETYAKTVFLLTYDENDGFFDHVPPPVPPPGTPGEEYVDGWPIGLGARVPMTVVSPWSRGGYVCSETFDHTSVVRFLERWTGVAVPNITAWRRAMCGDLTATLRGGTRSATGLSDRKPGTRPAHALPYQPEAYLSLDGSLAMTNTGSAALQLAVYANEYRTDGPWRFDLNPDPDAVVREDLAIDGHYDLSCHGPNRFLRRFTGDSAVRVSLTSAVDQSLSPASNPTLNLTLTNDTGAPVTFTVESMHYLTETRTFHVPAGGTATDVWHARWYDLNVTCDADESWSRRLIGHIEDGRDSVSG